MMESTKVFHARKLRRVACMVFACLLFMIQSMPVMAEDIERKVIKVGFFEADGYHMEDENGVKSGYGYDFLKMAETYNNWSYEYVGYDKGWSDMLTMLDNGEIDLVTFAQKTPEREEKFDFSDKPIGTGSVILTVAGDSTGYVVGDATTYDGMRIGIQTGSTHEDALKELSSEKGFSYTPVYYNSLQELKDALQNGTEIDAMVSSSRRTIQNELILEEMDPVDFYAIVKKGNTELLDEINYAISQMDLNTPSWRTTLSEQYFSSDTEDELVLSKDELEYIEQLKEAGTVLVVATNPDLAPYSYFVDGEAEGIAPEIFRQIADRAGLSYEFVTFDSYEDYNSFVRDGGADIDLTCSGDYGLAEYHHIELTNSYMTTTLALLTQDTFSGEIESVAELTASDKNTIYTDEIFGNLEIQKYDTNQACIDAVLRGDVDGAYFYTYTAQKAVEEDAKNKLMYSILPEYSINMTFGVRDDMDYRLVAILNEGIQSVKGNFIQNVIQSELNKIAETDTVISLIYDYPEAALVLAFIFLAVIFVTCLALIRVANGRKEHLQAKELSRFMGYVCEANEVVMEINLDKQIISFHNMSNGEMTNKEVPYDVSRLLNYDEMIYPEDFKLLQEQYGKENFWNTFSNSKDGEYFEVRAKGRDGTYKWYSYTIRAIPKDKKHPNNFVVFKKNINEAVLKSNEQRKALEDALENAKSASAAKGQFLSKMSHEIRTPLNAVIGYMNIAADTEDENLSKIRHCIENAEIAAKHLLSIINDVLDFSSIESGKMKIAAEEFDLKTQIKSISSLFYNQATEKKVKFEVRLEQITEEWVIGDSLRLNQILMNLLSNAVKFTPEGGTVTLLVSQTRLEDKKVYLNFRVTDTGIGMTEEYQKKLFQPFEQESAKTAQKYGGTGLGLSITYNLINMMGGSIDVKSKEKEGTAFTVSLYFGRTDNPHNQLPAIQHDYSRIRILVVDDDASSAAYIKELLKRCKIKCDIVHDGENAIKQIRRRIDTEYKYDLCIMDWNMPHMNGIEVAKQIQEEFDTDLPIIIATAYDTTELEEDAKKIGVRKVIAKPLFQSTMFDLIVSMFGKYEPQQSEQQSKKNLAGLHVLLAEDNMMNQEIAIDILNKAEIDVEAVSDGQQAYEHFIQAPKGTYDVILMDVQMPVMDGYQATGAIRKSSHPEAKTIPIIAMTANAFAEDVAAALASGMNGHIAKPIDFNKLFEVLNQYYKGKEEEKYE